MANVNEYYSRAWAIGCLNNEDDDALISNTNVKNRLKTNMRNFFDNENLTVKFEINSKTGEAIGTFRVNTLVAGSNNNNFTTIKQNVGDMICSDYLVIKGRNYLNSNHKISVNNCHKITSNESLTNVLVFFKNMYL